MRTIESKTVRTAVTRRVEINRENILSLIEPHMDCGSVPDNAAIYIQVPGGGDWSNTQLDIDDKNPVVVTWTEVTDDQS